MEIDPWVIQINDQINHEPLDDSDRWEHRCIYKLPGSVIGQKMMAYTPKVVSFGPYHRNDPWCFMMEEHKDRTVIQFLKRSKIQDVQVLYDVMEKVVHDLMAAYDSLDHEMQNDKKGFLRLMIRDGCFMLEVMRLGIGRVNDYPSNDPIFSDRGMPYVISDIKRDMLLLENQLPMLVIHKLLQVEHALSKENDKLANTLVSSFFFLNSLREAPTNSYHALDLYRQSILGPRPKTSKTYGPEFGGWDVMIRSALEMDEAGITMKYCFLNRLNNISYENGVLRLPKIVVDKTTESLFLNLMAYERFHAGTGNGVTSYVKFMDTVIGDAKDISFLHTKDIIQNAIGSNEEVAKLFHSLAYDVTLDGDSDLGIVNRTINDYCQKRWPRLRANLKRRYFPNPWAFISVVAAILLFVLTIAQTAYTVVAYYHPKTT